MSKFRHPEKQKNPINPIKKKPEWIRSKLTNSREFFLTKSIVNQNRRSEFSSMELLAIAAVFIPFSALVMNAFSGDNDDDFDFL